MKKTIAVGCFCIIVIVTVWSTNRSQVLNDAMSMLQLNVGQNNAQMVSTDMGLELLPKDSQVIIGLQGGVFDSPITASIREWLNKEGSSSSFKSTLPDQLAFIDTLSTKEACGYDLGDKIQSIYLGVISFGSVDVGGPLKIVINLKQSSYQEINQCLGKQYIAYRQQAKISENKDLDLQFSTMEQGRLVLMKTDTETMWLRWVNDQRALIEFNDKKPQRVTNSNGILDNKAMVRLLNRVDQNGSIWLTVLKSRLGRETLRDIHGSFMMTDSIKGSLTIQSDSQENAEKMHKTASETIASVPQMLPILVPFEKVFSVTKNPNHEVMINMLMSPELVKQAGTLIKAQFAHK